MTFCPEAALRITVIVAAPPFSFTVKVAELNRTVGLDGVAVDVGVLVGVKVGVGGFVVAVGGTGVFVTVGGFDVAVGGTGVLVAVGEIEVDVGGTGVFVGTAVFVHAQSVEAECPESLNA